jgi:hypothetical protein
MPNLDSDGDGINIPTDNCPDTANPGQEDGDGDGTGDACDVCPLDNPDDTDGDGLCDSDDPCPLDNPGDTDGDGICDSNDACPEDPNKVNPGHCGCGNPETDTDGDAVPDCVDPCPLDNPNDTDGDGQCNSNDPCPLDNPNDTDGDGVCDSDDPCPLDNPDDRDGDGVCNSDDPCPFDNPDDEDGDGICDRDDYCFGDNSRGDCDLDGICNDLDPCESPVLIGAVSRKTHSTTPIPTTWDIDVGAGETECRSAQLGTGNPNEVTIIATFDKDIGLLGFGSEVVSTDVGTIVDAYQTDMKVMSIMITDLPLNAQINLGFHGVVDGWSFDPATASPSTLCMRVMVGDYDNQGRVNFIDFAKIKNDDHLNKPIASAENARADFDCSGQASFNDFVSIKAAGLINATVNDCAKPIGP